MNKTGHPKPLLIVIAGPTAAGKTDLSIRLADALASVILSADSRQFYKEIPIGSAAPDIVQMSRVKHYFVGNRSVTEPYDAAQYEKEALALLETLFASSNVVIMTGGSGLYIDAVCRGFDELPDSDPDLRREIEQQYENGGLDSLRTSLRLLDPDYYNDVDLHNPKRLMRAIEVCLLTGRPYSQLRTHQPRERFFDVFKIALTMPRDELFQRIHRRVDAMMEAGLLAEALSLNSQRHLNTLQTVGYTELFEYAGGSYTLDEAVEKIKTNTRRYAKRQLTWFKKDPAYHWINLESAAAFEEILAICCERLENRMF
jgi:tRNA dimethylallyltransferase